MHCVPCINVKARFYNVKGGYLFLPLVWPHGIIGYLD
jgi:hypothetical protein